MRTITIKHVSENPMTGAQRWKVSPEAAFTIMSWLDGDTSKIRSYRAHKDGGFGFTTGIGYAIFDDDLLGGNGDGRTEKRFHEEYGVYLITR